MKDFFQNIISVRFIEAFSYLTDKRIVASMTSFASELDFSVQSLNEILKGRRDVTTEVLRKLFNKHRQFNSEYFFLGEGEMLKSPNQAEPATIKDVAAEVSVYKGLLKEKEDKIEALNREIGNLMLQIEQLKNPKPPDEIIEPYDPNSPIQIPCVKLKPAEKTQKV